MENPERTEFQRRLMRVVQIVFDHSESATAKAVALPASTIHRMITGAIAEPRSSKLTRIADALGVPAAWLRGEQSTHEAMGAEPGFTEPQWLLRCYASARQREDRQEIEQLPADEQLVGRAIAALRLVPGEDGFPLRAVVDLLNRWPLAAPQRVHVERQFADLETALIRLARTRPEDVLQSLVIAPAKDEV